MLGWVQRVLPQPPGTRQKTKEEEEEEKEAEPQPEPEPEPEPELELEAEPGPQQEAEAAPEEEAPEDMPQVRSEGGARLPLEEPVDGEGVAEADPDQGECWDPSCQGRGWVSSDPRNWVLTWLLKSMDKVVPQPVCNARGAHNTAAGVEDPAQAGDQTLGTCGTGDAGKAQKLSPWLLRWLEHNLEKVLPQPPKPSEVSGKSEGEPPVLPVETEPPESPSLPNPGALEPEEDPATETQPGLHVSSLPPPGDPARLIAWLLHRLEMALPQPVLHRKIEEQVCGGPGWWQKGSWELR
uniref:Cyclic nucleotide-gated cation channel beta-1 n=1 Tax=Jaculus jaculus TaxID=51337 RepID=A0A8C5L8E4_JACJA